MLILAAAGALMVASPATAARTFWTIRPVPPADMFWVSRAPIGPDHPPLIALNTPTAGDFGQHWVFDKRITKAFVNGKWVNAPGYQIRNRLSKGCIGMIGGGVQWRADGQPLVEIPCDPNRFPTITWHLQLGGKLASRPVELPRSRTTAGYLIRNTYSRKCLGSPLLTYAAGTQLQQLACGYTTAQRWRLGFFTVP